jgi:hypothetical protein
MNKNYCETCKFRNEKGYCTNDKISENYWYSNEEKIDMLVYSYPASGNFFVGLKFGCVHHEAR